MKNKTDNRTLESSFINNWTYIRDFGFFTEEASPEGFKFNENSVCLNPETVVIHRSKQFFCKVEFCCCNGYWSYGYQYSVNIGSCTYKGSSASHPGTSRDTQKRFAERPIFKGQFYSSRQDALTAALDQAQQFFERAYTNNEGKVSVSSVINDIAAARIPQLTLF